MTVPSQESEQSCICVSGIDFAFSSIFFIVFWNCSNSVVFFVFQFINRTVLNLFIPNMEF